MRRWRTRLGAGVVSLLVIAGCTSIEDDAPPPAAKTPSTSTSAAVVMTDVPYARASAAQKLDLSVPAHHGLVPLVVVIHGGSFARGDKNDVRSLTRALNRAGLAAASINYRLSGEARYPAGVDDARASVAWLRAHAAEHGIDPERIAVWGLSAGGLLAAMVGATGDDHPASAVSAVVSWFGVSDFRTLAAQAVDPGGCPDPAQRTNRLANAELAWLGTTAERDPALGAASSPVTHLVKAPNPAKRTAVPPFLLVHGAADCLVPYGQSQELARAVAGAGGAARLVLVPGAAHADPVIERTQTAPTVTFLRGVLTRG